MPDAPRKPPHRFDGSKPGPGRHKGVPNKATKEIRAAAQAFVEDPTGRRKLLAQYRSGKLNPRLVEMFHHYAYGKPKDTVTIEGGLTIQEVHDAKRSLAGLLGRLAERVGAGRVVSPPQ